MFPSPCGVLGVKPSDKIAILDSVQQDVSVPLRGVRRETPHIFEAYTVKLLIGSISTGHLYSQKTCQIRNKTTNIKTETLTDRATSIGQRNNAIFKVDATYGGD